MFWLEDGGVQDWNKLRACQNRTREGELELRLVTYDCIRARLV